jgi:hypothetical protein
MSLTSLNGTSAHEAAFVTGERQRTFTSLITTLVLTALLLYFSAQWAITKRVSHNTGGTNSN